MLKIKKLGNAYLIENKLVFGEEIQDTQYIDLKTYANADDVLCQMKEKVIDFPGEYDIEKIFIKAILGKNNTMNYFIKMGKKSFAIIQDAKILQQDELQRVNNWIYTNEKVEKKLDQLELEGDKINLNTIETNETENQKYE